MQVLSLTRQSSHDLRDILGLDNVFRVKDGEFLVFDKFFSLHLLGQGRKALETPFLVRYALEPPVAVLCDLFLPALFSSFPLRPGIRSFLRDPVHVAKLLGRPLSSSLTVYESLSR